MVFDSPRVIALFSVPVFGIAMFLQLPFGVGGSVAERVAARSNSSVRFLNLQTSVMFAREASNPSDMQKVSLRSSRQDNLHEQQNSSSLESKPVRAAEAGDPLLLAAGRGRDLAYYTRLNEDEYCRKPLPGVTGVHHFYARDSEAAVGRQDGHCIVVFRGATNLLGLLRWLQGLVMVSLDGCPGCRVGDGLLAGYRAVSEQVKRALKRLSCKSVLVTGYSLGAGHAELAMYELGKMGYHILPTYLFGEPPVFNPAFHHAFHSTIHANVVRVIHGKDPVTHIGPKEGASPWGGAVYQPGKNPLSDHFMYTGVYMIACHRRNLPDYIIGGRLAEHVVEQAVAAVPGLRDALHEAEWMAEDAFVGFWEQVAVNWGPFLKDIW
eukprot:TRINITY_DN6699_c0_g1_i2.p1 TRINITY_DN6699_c0_g1~~TRINITY_DN6699_c0_g1_i2.p1  ORF type:complete len:379 (-),score=51.38 TRINITY_DN6699_c0_g1_i2:120-1256(-)